MENQIKTAALYIRVSTDKQEELSPDSQKRLLLEYAKNHDMIVSQKHIYMENGISGRKADKRPKFQQMIAAAKSEEHPFDVILLWKFSRFARNQEESIVYKSMLRNKCHVDVVSISEPLIEGPFGGLIERIIEWMDEFYSIRLSGAPLDSQSTSPMVMPAIASLNLHVQHKYLSLPTAHPIEGGGNPSQVCPEGQAVTRKSPLTQAKQQQNKQKYFSTKSRLDNVISRFLKAS